MNPDHFRMRSIGLLLLVALSLLPYGSRAQGNDLNIQIRQIDLSQFPSVLLRISISKPLNSNIDVNAGNARLSENGILQNIDYFDCPQDSSIRLSLALLVDRSRSMRLLPNDDDDPDSTKIRAAKAAISAFLDLLGDRDEAAIFSFATRGNFIPVHDFRVEHDFSTDHASLQRSLSQIIADGGTSLWEALIDAVDRLRVRPGRKALILLTDGRNMWRQNLRSRAVQNAVNEGIPVYPIGLGDDIDVGELSSLASATGGRFYRAPDVDDLKDIFNRLGSELITDDCVLRYTSSNPCLDGSRRDIELTMTGLGFFGQADSAYTVERRLNPVTVFVERGIQAPARDTILVPVTVLELFSTSQPLSYTMTMRYDPSLMRFLGIDTEGTMSEGGDVEVFEDVPGTLRIQLMNHLPAIQAGHLFALQFAVYPSTQDSTTQVDIADAAVIGICPFEMTREGAAVQILACTERFTLGSGEKYLVEDGGELLVPLTIAPRPEPGRPLRLRVLLENLGPSLEFLGVERSGTLAQGANLLVQEADGALDLFLDHDAVGVGDTLLLLRFRGHGSKQPVVHPLEMTLAEMVTGCLVDHALLPPAILVDGICQPVVRRKAPAPALFNHPNPFGGETTLTFALPEEADVDLSILDGEGRQVKTLLRAHLRAGTYTHRLQAASLPAGDYLAVLRINGAPVVRRIMLLR